MYITKQELFQFLFEIVSSFWNYSEYNWNYQYLYFEP